MPDIAENWSSKQALQGQMPPVLAGPILRHTTLDRLVLWLVGSSELAVRLRLTIGDRTEPELDRRLTAAEVQTVRLGSYAYLHLINVELETALPADIRIAYDIGVCRQGLTERDADESWIREWAPHLCLPGASSPDFVVKGRIDRLFHGSCRRPHHHSVDGLGRLDHELLEAGTDVAARPALLLMTGDQIYADDVAGPMLRAIHALIDQLELVHEGLEGSTVADSRALLTDPSTYYHRQRLLPATEDNLTLVKRFFRGASKPIFTTSHAQNHLISLAEVMAMYLLVWSPVCWQMIQPTTPALPEAEARRYRQEQVRIDAFVADLPRSARALAHIPTYMIFDDHDVTDDWNLSALWEETIYGHPFSRRIVGNALIGYLLCQAWGNNPASFEGILPQLQALLNKRDSDPLLDRDLQDALIHQLFRFQQWHYTVATSPPLVVLDTRTRRWRSGILPQRPSGLMDWEALIEFQGAVMGHKAVVVVSPAPMFGVKLIETIQRVFTYFGQPLLVDAENWMGHRGTANVLLNIFGHSDTPNTFVILSGDVHYSFVYDVRLRQKPDGPKIWQITSSGIKNEFPKQLLEWLDRMNRWLYAPRSPLNWFTKRRRMRIEPRMPTGREAGERLWNNSGIGVVELDEQGVPVDIRQLNATAGETRFLPRRPSGSDRLA